MVRFLKVSVSMDGVDSDSKREGYIRLGDGRPRLQVGATYDMMAHGCVLSAAGQIETRDFVTGQIRCVCRAWCHARILPGLDCA
jgi:hypothetical protein